MYLRLTSPLSLAGLGCLLALLPPLGWWFIEQLADDGSPPSRWLYVYLFFVSASSLGGAGILTGILLGKLKHAEKQDGLTRLLNQRGFLQAAESLVNLAIRKKQPVALIMLDVDHFKEVNDNHSHLVGSHVLKQIAGIIRQSTRKSDVIARYGGDEFIILLPESDLQSAATVAERIRKTVQGTFFRHGPNQVNVSVSLGVVGQVPDVNFNLKAMIEQADKALYEAKDRGRNQTVAFRPVSLRMGG